MSYLDDVKTLVSYIDGNRDYLVVWHEYKLEEAVKLLQGVKDDIVSKRKL